MTLTKGAQKSARSHMRRKVMLGTPSVKKKSFFTNFSEFMFITVSGGARDPKNTVFNEWGGGPLQKFSKLRFFKNYDTLTLILPRRKTQLTKVVSPLKGFGDPMQTL